MSFSNAYSGKRVLVTGHTGFKGSWLCEWLLALGAEVAGFALAPETEPALFDQLRLAKRLEHRLGDIRDLSLVKKIVGDVAPDFVFHLAAQPLVRASYEMPVETFAVNAIGTAHLLEAIRALEKNCAVVCITTDKVYENLEAGRAFREDDKLGGHDPYSASKAAAEIVIESYRKSFFSRDSRIALASARAGNVLGGGDWAADRIVPDAMRALARGEEISVRNPNSTRPWQHVLEPLGGYLALGAHLSSKREGGNLKPENTDAESPLQVSSFRSQVSTSFNFGPTDESNRTVAELVEEILKSWPGKWRDISNLDAPHEARLLHLDTCKAAQLLGWRPMWNFSETVKRTVEWYRAVDFAPKKAGELTRRQISDYVAAH